MSGKFSPESRAIYDIVLKMQLECIRVLKEGVVWDEVHLLAHKLAIEGLLSLGILKGDPEEILKNRTSVAFLPHGLGHYLGMDTHDTGGNANYADKDTMFRYLRVRGKLPAGAVITVEPGVSVYGHYAGEAPDVPDAKQFPDLLLQLYYRTVLEESETLQIYRCHGPREVLGCGRRSVRPLFGLVKSMVLINFSIEDNILITKEGTVNLTPAIKDVAEMEKLISSS